MRLEERRMRGLLGRVAILIALLAASLVAISEPAFAQSVTEDQYASAASDQYQDGTSGQMPVGPNDPAYPNPPDPEFSGADPSQMPVSPDYPADPGLASGSPGAFDQAPNDVSANLDSNGQSLTAPSSSSASTAGTTTSEPHAAPPAGDAQALGDVSSSLSALLGAITPSTTTIGSPWVTPPTVADQCVSGPNVLCVGGGDPLPPPMVVDQCTPGSGVACIGGGAQPDPSGSFTGGASSPTGFVPSLIDSLVRQANDNVVTDWLVDDPGDSDGDGAVFTDLNPGSYDADPTDRDSDNRVFSDPDESDPDE